MQDSDALTLSFVITAVKPQLEVFSRYDKISGGVASIGTTQAHFLTKKKIHSAS